MSRRSSAATRAIRELAHLCGVQLSYLDILARRRRSASLDSLLAVLGTLGEPIENLAEAPAALREKRIMRWREWSEPVCVASGGEASLSLRFPAAAAGRLHCSVALEDGSKRDWTPELDELPIDDSVEIEGERFHARRLLLPEPLPIGYHHLSIEHSGKRSDVHVIAPPRGAYLPRGSQEVRTWGVFLPLHALYSERSWGCGDFHDLERLMDWVSGLGGGVVATLPFLAAFLDTPFEPSPYAPVSRLFWNELFLDVTAIPELQHSPAAQALMGSSLIQDERRALQAASLVDYRRCMALKRKVLEELARTLYAYDNPRRAELEQFVDGHPILQDYSRFRAVCERQGAPWPTWEPHLRDRDLQEGDFDNDVWRYHLYVQWLAHQQLHAFATKARRTGPGLYLDLPLGVHPDGYDVWRFREAFASGVSGGSPPDSFFTKGQNWGFPPLHPERIRQQGYRYFIHCLRHHLQYADVLRIDHVMGLHRLFWVPNGRKATEGVYVRYHAEELYAILSLESQRHTALIVGEDLGTVPPAVRPAMARHHVLRTYVAQFEITPAPRPLLRLPVKNSLASLNTHDTPTFSGFWEALDIDDRIALGLLDPSEAQLERESRIRLKEALVAYLVATGRLASGNPDPAAVLRGCLSHLASSPARVVNVNLEDFWGERSPQNVPGTTTERPNWLRKADFSLENFCQNQVILDILKEINQQRADRWNKG